MNWFAAAVAFFGLFAVMGYGTIVMKVSDWADQKTGRGWVGFMVWMCGFGGVLLAIAAGLLWDHIP